jgi:hypothetical protein
MDMAKKPAKSADHRRILEELHSICTKTFSSSMDEKNNALLGKSFVFASDFDSWNKALAGRREHVLLISAAHELSVGMLCNAQGQYRNGFKSLRLVLELVLQAIYLSANLVPLSEWLSNARDTAWSALSNVENGVLSNNFAKAFFPELSEHVRGVNTLATTLYRELSECIHGNVPKHIPLPNELRFDEKTFELWHAKLETVRSIAIFALTMRYVPEMPRDVLNSVETSITEELGHLEAIRTLLKT